MSIQVISIKNDIFTKKKVQFQISLFGIKTGILSESLNYAESDNFSPNSQFLSIKGTTDLVSQFD